MKTSFKGLSIWQTICFAVKNGLKKGRDRRRDETADARQLYANELRKLRADRAERNRRQN